MPPRKRLFWRFLYYNTQIYGTLDWSQIGQLLQMYIYIGLQLNYNSIKDFRHLSPFIFFCDNMEIRDEIDPRKLWIIFYLQKETIIFIYVFIEEKVMKLLSS